VDIDLKIPFDRKDEVKDIAWKAGGRLRWNGAPKKTWTFTGAQFPPDLEKYQLAAQTQTGDQTFVLDIPYALREIVADAGVRYNGEAKAYLYRGVAPPDYLNPYRSQPYSRERMIEDEINGQALVATPPERDDIVPRPHQVEAVRLTLANRRAGRPGFLVADEVGLGKTIEVWDAILKMENAESVLISCPLSVIAAWRQTIRWMGDGGKRIVIINYDRLQKLLEVDREIRSKVKSRKGVAKRGVAAEFDVVVLDESHKCRNPAAARSKLVAKLVAQGGFAIWMSATAGQTPLELSYLAPLLANVTGSRASDLADFEKWCLDQDIGVTRGKFGKWEWGQNPEDCARFHRMLFGGKLPAGIRRLPQDIAGWPEINRILLPAEFDPDQRSRYDQAWSQFGNEMRLRRAGEDAKATLVRQLRFRQKSSIIRVPGTVEMAVDLLEQGQQVAISVAFIETLEMIREEIEGRGFDCSIINGGLTPAVREENRLAFQKGRNKVCIFTVEEGISLHQGEYNDAPRSEIVHDIRWSAIQLAQIEGRCHRDGKFAQVYWMFAAETVEEQIAAVVVNRIKSMKAMQGDDVETIREIERVIAKRGGFAATAQAA
jgi:hypothetical protein